MREFIVAVDVGTGSARAGVFDLGGMQMARVVTAIGVHQPDALFYEQNSAEIWQAVAQSVRGACEQAGVQPDEVVALGFDATCSLVLRDGNGTPVAASKSGPDQQDTMLWMDHRAIAEANEISSSSDPTLDRFGGYMSPEMQPPKLLWLKRNLPESWARAGLIFDLCDYLTWRATGSTSRSHSALAAKWAYEPDAPGAYPERFYQRIGLEDARLRTGLPEHATPSCEPIGTLSEAAAKELGLSTKCIVAAGLIDAYAGTIGVFCQSPEEAPTHAAALIAGTSSCVVVLRRCREEKPGVWGGFCGAALPGLWLMEAGQSSSGSLLDFLLRRHDAGGPPSLTLHMKILDRIAERIAQEGPAYGRPIAVLPDLHGSRGPMPDPAQTGAFSGLSLEGGFDNLCRLYWRTCVGLACGIRHVLENMPDAEMIATLLMGGGLAAHPLIPQLYADMTGRTVRVDETRDPVLLGTMINAAVAAGRYSSHAEAAANLTGSTTKTIAPRPDIHTHLAADYAAYHAMMRHRDELARILAVT
ncbi:FGGY-family carbohydrate kinase [Rhizobium sp. L1K21]|uniref:FGGY-family carbohydrate kinase n=1 Tax=Rhizobium sp. L1K21 TaxID=2954933 RepID=UPI0020938C21|nr:FGGY-family carbohydrate kinase [Rhizobium sp. L1K21]MCO6188335.1 FGGY-family carbohydrate kinase [Rhizobium sp. L1K21]